MKSTTIVLLSGLAISIGMIAVVAINDKRLIKVAQGETSPKPFMTKGQQHNLMLLSTIPVLIGGGITLQYGIK